MKAVEARGGHLSWNMKTTIPEANPTTRNFDAKSISNWERATAFAGAV